LVFFLEFVKSLNEEEKWKLQSPEPAT
jgi:hypothetical protein